MPDRFDTLVHIVQRHVDTDPDRPCLVFLTDESAEPERLTRAQLERRARAYAASLREATQPGERALLLFPAGVEYVAAFLGCLYAGVIAVPAYPPEPTNLLRSLPRLRAMVEDSGATVVLTSTAGGQLRALLAERAPEFDRLRWLTGSVGADAGESPRLPAPTDLAFLQYTSGSTAAPKGVMVSHSNVIANQRMIQRSFSTSASTVCVGWLPLYHDMGLIGNVLHELYLGCPLVFMSPLAFLKRPLRWLRAIADYRGTISGGPNFAFDYCVERIKPEVRATLDLSSWRVAFNGAEPIRQETLARFCAAFADSGFRPQTFVPCYGMAEATLIISGGKPLCETDLTAKKYADLERGRQPLVGCGEVLAPQALLLVDPETRRPCAPGTVGEIWVRGEHVAQGYWGRPDETERTFRARTASDDGPYLRTGDLGLLEGSELFVTGRLKDVIIVRGTNHAPQDIELSAERCDPAIRRGSVCAFSAPLEGAEELVLTLELRPAQRLAPDLLCARIAEVVTETHGVRPAAVVLVHAGSTAKTSSGKLQRQRMRQAFLSSELKAEHQWSPRQLGAQPTPPALAAPADDSAGRERTLAPPPPLERAEALRLRDYLVRWVADHVGIDPAQVDAQLPFAHYGVDSKLAVAVVGQLEELLGRTLPTTLLYEQPSIERLVSALAAGAPLPARAAPQSESQHEDDPIAVIGLSCRLPGAPCARAFWQLLRDGVDAVGELPESRWPRHVEHRAGALPEIDGFDPGAFGIDDREAGSMDPQQRLLLELSWEAMEDSGEAPQRWARSRTGVFVGATNSGYGAGATELDVYRGTGSAISVAAGRVSYVFGLEGPCLAIDTACSSSLAALHTACRSLAQRECDRALAGGAQLLVDPTVTAYLATLGVLSPTGRCHAFSAAADGYVRGEGGGMVVLKRLRDALAAGDPIRAVVRASAMNHDGASNGLTAPRGEAQQAVMHEALVRASVEPHQVSYLEAHGTGTALGDPIEVAAIAAVYGAAPRATALQLGSVKTNIGHLETAAGIAGFIKVVLMLQHRTLVPSLHCSTPSPRVPWAQLPVEVNQGTREWQVERRVGAVSSFGLSGTNVHAIVEEAPAHSAAKRVTDRGPLLLALSAHSAEALRALAGGLHDVLAQAPAAARSISERANRSRSGCAERAAWVVASQDELAPALEAFAAGRSPAPYAGRARRAPVVAMLFSGQGCQYPGMGLSLLGERTAFSQALERCDAAFRAELDVSLLEVLGAPERGNGVDAPLYTQPALFALQVALVEHWRALGIEPTIVVGHSIGEYAAAWTAGVLSFEDAVQLVAARARSTALECPEGRMLVARGDQDAVAPVAHALGLAIAAINGPQSTVLSGEPDAIEAAAVLLHARGIDTRRLDVSRAFHSTLMRPALASFERALAGRRFAAPRLTWISSVSGEPVQVVDAEYWAGQLERPVAFGRALASLDALQPDVLLELGPGAQLIDLHRAASSRTPARVASLRSSVPEAQQLSAALSTLYVHGAEPRWPTPDSGFDPRVPSLPVYPFQRRRFWTSSGPTPRLASPEPSPVPSAIATGGVRAVSSELEHLLETLGGPALDRPLHAGTVFAELGLDSMLLLEALRRIEQRFGVRVSLEQAFGSLSTLGALAAHITSRMTARAPAPATTSPPPPVAARSAAAQLDAAQLSHLAHFIPRYTRATARSRERRVSSQRSLADIRSSAGFRVSFPESVKAQWRARKHTCYPIVVQQADGATVTDVDGNTYVDFTMGFGVHLFGHRVPWLNDALQAQLLAGAAVGPQSERAERVANLLTSMTGTSRVAFCSSGTEAVMLSLRLARAVTGRQRVVLFSGSYHGSSDGTLASIPRQLGTPLHDTDVLVLPYGTAEALDTIRAHAAELAAVLVEPVQSRKPELQPRAFLQELRKLTADAGVALIFDEVLLGFRIHQGGAQAHFDVRADIVTYGKIVGGGLPIGLVAGERRFLDAIDGGEWDYDGSEPTVDPIWCAGTFSKNPLTLAAAEAVLSHLAASGPGLQANLNARTGALVERFNARMNTLDVAARAVHCGSLVRLELTPELDLLYHHLLLRGVYVWEGRSLFVSTAHDESQLDLLVDASEDSLREMLHGRYTRTRSTAARSRVRSSSPLSTPVPRSGAPLRLVCFPYAGGTTAAFSGWQRALRAEVELSLVRLPGRDADEGDAGGSFAELVGRLSSELGPVLRAPFVFFGHSMGALLAFEVARALRAQGLPEPLSLILSGEPAPHDAAPVDSRLDLEPLSDRSLWRAIGARGFLPDSGAELPPGANLKLLRHDLALCASYVHEGAEPLSSAISVLVGSQDRSCSPAQATGWVRHTTGAFSLRTIPGDHFFLRTSPAATLRALDDELETVLESLALPRAAAHNNGAHSVAAAAGHAAVSAAPSGS